jgi:pyoverdine/dityrosine biosynthesis protein Dit1
MNNQEILAKANLIIKAFEAFRMPAQPNDEFISIGKQKLAEKMMPFIAADAPIQFTMLGYPMKSSNDRDKVIGKLPDLAEQVSLQNFATFNEEIKKVHAKGVNINIISDGFVFNDLLDIEDNTVSAYEEMTRDYGKIAPINFMKLQDFYNNDMSLASMRGTLMEQFGITDVELERRIMFDPDVNYLYRGMIKFMTEELANRNYPSGNQLQKAAKKLARAMMFRNEAYSTLVKDNFSSYIRLSMHPSVNNGAKYSFQMIPSPKAWTSPWHCALLVYNDGSIGTVHKKDAIAEGHELVMQDGRPLYFHER